MRRRAQREGSREPSGNTIAEVAIKRSREHQQQGCGGGAKGEIKAGKRHQISSTTVFDGADPFPPSARPDHAVLSEELATLFFARLSRKQSQTPHFPAVRRLEDDSELQNAVLSIFHANEITFNGPAAKVIENRLNRRMVVVEQNIALQPPPPVQPGSQLSRQQRRALQRQRK